MVHDGFGFSAPWGAFTARAFGVALAGCLLIGTVGARTIDDRAGQALERGATHAHYWQAGWATFYGGGTAWSAWQGSEADDREDRYDARVDAVKSALGLASVFLYAPSHGQALNEYRDAGETGPAARALLATLAEEEQQRRAWRARLGGLLVNGLAGLTIGVGDNRPDDGWVNFATGMLTTELNIRTRPNTASAFLETHPDFTLKGGGGSLPVYVDAWVMPMGAGFVARF